MIAEQLTTFGDLGLSVIEVDGLTLVTREIGSGFEQMWVQVKHPTETTVAYNGKFYQERP